MDYFFALLKVRLWKLLRGNLFLYGIRESYRIFLSCKDSPVLSYIESHIVDHCNLNCKGCSHFCPLVSTNYVDPHQYEKDIQRLKNIFANINTIKLLGGEPLLHPTPEYFIIATRAAFPKSRILFVTNGILLPEVSDIFWNICRNTNTTLQVSLYPPMKNKYKFIKKLCRVNHVNVNITPVSEFRKRLNICGNSDKKRSFKRCRKVRYYPILKNGHIYVCPTAAYIHCFNEKFDFQIPIDSGINIYLKNIDGLRILKQLNEPVETCSWCSYNDVWFQWSISNKLPDDWDINEP